jgi:hypothetical protein
MNERIKELALRAGMVKILEEHAHEYGNGAFENTPYPELEKFAELIVKECCAITDEVERTDLPVVASKFVKAHFGVEE